MHGQSNRPAMSFTCPVASFSALCILHEIRHFSRQRTDDCPAVSPGGITRGPVAGFRELAL
jgi:hypothetical protein